MNHISLGGLPHSHRRDPHAGACRWQKDVGNPFYNYRLSDRMARTNVAEVCIIYHFGRDVLVYYHFLFAGRIEFRVTRRRGPA